MDNQIIRLRQSIEFAKSYFGGKTNIIVEVGVLNGSHALHMYDALQPETFYLVDFYAGPANTLGRLPNYETAKKNLKDIPNHHFIIKASHIAAKDVPDNLDLVYIDATHNYPDVLLDIKSWWPKIRKDGILCGHDWKSDQVRKAIEEFFPTFDLSIPRKKRVDWGAEMDKDPFDDWWIVKNKKNDEMIVITTK